MSITSRYIGRSILKRFDPYDRGIVDKPWADTTLLFYVYDIKSDFRVVIGAVPIEPGENLDFVI
jgi:hypothetical protein